MSSICDFGRILKTEWNLQYFTRNCRIENFDEFERDEADTYLWKAGLVNVKEKRMTIRCIMNWCLVMFLRGGKVNVVQHWWNIVAKLKGEQVITLQMDQQLKTKIINVVTGQLSCRQCKAKCLLETVSLYWWSR